MYTTDIIVLYTIYRLVQEIMYKSLVIGHDFMTWDLWLRYMNLTILLTHITSFHCKQTIFPPWVANGHFIEFCWLPLYTVLFDANSFLFHTCKQVMVYVRWFPCWELGVVSKWNSSRIRLDSKGWDLPHIFPLSLIGSKNELPTVSALKVWFE